MPLGGNLIFPLAALANPSAKRAEALASCQQSHQAQVSPTATSPVDGTRARAGPVICTLLSSCVRQQPPQMPAALQGAQEGQEVPGQEDTWWLARQVDATSPAPSPASAQAPACSLSWREIRLDETICS